MFVIALLTCCRAVEQIKGVYCSAQPAQYGICSTASQFESVSLVYCLEAMVCAFFYKVSALRLKPFESSVIDFSITNLFRVSLCFFGCGGSEMHNKGIAQQYII